MAQLYAAGTNELYGSWYSALRTLHDGTETIEKENLTFNGNNTFTMVILVSLKKTLRMSKTCA